MDLGNSTFISEDPSWINLSMTQKSEWIIMGDEYRTMEGRD